MREFLGDEIVDPHGGDAAAEGSADPAEDFADCCAYDGPRSRLQCYSHGGSQRFTSWSGRVFHRDGSEQELSYGLRVPLRSLCEN
jgi:hypothetical protein